MSFRRRVFLGGAMGITATAALDACTASGNGGDGGDGAVTGTVRFSTWFGPGDIPMWKSVITDFEKANPGITIKFEPLDYGNFGTKLNTQIASGSAPDIFGTLPTFTNLAKAGQIEPLQTVMSSQLPAISKSLLQFGQTFDSGQYAMPWRFVGSSLYANATAFDDAGIKLPLTNWTIDEFLSAAKELTKGGSYGTLVPAGTMQVALESAFGANPLSPDNTKAMFATDEMIAFKTFLRDLVYVHKVAPAPPTVSTTSDPFASGTVRMTFQGSWNTPVYRGIKKFNWDILANPSGAEKAKPLAGPDMVSVYAKSKNKPAAEAFVKYVSFDLSAQQKIAATGSPVLTDYLTDPARIKKEASLKPSNYEYFVKQAGTNGSAWITSPKSDDLAGLESDATFRIFQSSQSDIPAILKDLNAKAQAVLDSQK